MVNVHTNTEQYDTGEIRITTLSCRELKKGMELNEVIQTGTSLAGISLRQGEGEKSNILQHPLRTLLCFNWIWLKRIFSSSERFFKA
ncbi:Uncharacterised protein [Citrobacter freundii]|nr:Uncharacterised protein [Citrobacter freundii]